MFRFKAVPSVTSSIRNGKHKERGREVRCIRGSHSMTLKPTFLSDVMPCSSIEVLLFLLVIRLLFLLSVPGSGSSSFPPEHLIFFYWTTGNTSQKTVSSIYCVI
jgi:hypothetical protein